MKATVADDTGEGDPRVLCRYHGIDIHVLDLKDDQPGPVSMKKSRAWIAAQLTILY